ncbi:MAG: hypothetical protein RL189_2647 [Pseudomonadota bacterium]|jgi:hypothetical protein
MCHKNRVIALGISPNSSRSLKKNRTLTGIKFRTLFGAHEIISRELLNAKVGEDLKPVSSNSAIYPIIGSFLPYEIKN